MKKFRIKTNRKLWIMLTAFILGALASVQSESLKRATDDLSRERKTNAFQEIKILKEKNSDLQKEIVSLEDSLDSISDQSRSLDVIRDEINKYKKLTGDSPIFGPGIIVSIDGQISVPWLVDLVNEFFNAGGESVSINGIRVTNDTVGFENLPNAKILMNGSVLASPYTFEIIGDSSSLADILNLPGGIFSRIQASFPSVKISLQKKDIIRMK